MSAEKIRMAIKKMDHYVSSILEGNGLFIDKTVLQKAQTAWINIGKLKITELNKHISIYSDETFYNVGLTDELLEFKIGIISFLNENLKEYARRVLDCIITFLSSLSRAISDSVVRMIIQVLKEMIIFIKNILK